MDFPLPNSIYNPLIDEFFWKVAVAVIKIRSELFETLSVFNNKRSSTSSTLQRIIS